MRRSLGFAGAVIVALALAAGAARAPELLGRFEVFRVRDVALEGATFLTPDEAARWASVPPDASVWDDATGWEASLERHPMVREARIGRDLPSTLVVEVDEREPVALAATPTLEAVDAEGRPLPLDPVRHRLDLPVIRPAGRADDPALTPADVRRLAREIGRLREVDPGFQVALSEVVPGGDGHVVARLTDPDVEVRYRPPLTSRRLRQGLRALSDAVSRSGEGAPRTVDLRYEDQVVVGLAGGPTRFGD